MKHIILSAFLLTAACMIAAAQAAVPIRVAPLVDHHEHLMGPGPTQLQSRPVLPAVELPQDLSRLLRERNRRWNNKTTIGELYTENAMLHDSRVPAWLEGRSKIADFIPRRFRAAYNITPVSFSVDGSRGYIAGYFTRDNTHIGHVHLSLEKGRDGVWQIAAESMTFPGPQDSEPFTAEQLISELDAAGIRRAVVLSVAYWLGSPLGALVPDEYAKVRAENDWVAEQVSRYPERLVGFCSFNPLKDYALEELERCAKNLKLKGIKLHFGNSGVDVRKAEHVEKVRAVFRAANERRLPIVAHLWTGGAYETEGGQHAQVFLDQILPVAPDITVQIAHLAGGGRSTDAALAVFADAIAAKDPRTKNLYFDIATSVDGNNPDQALERDAMRMRQIGLDRILWGSDMSGPNGNLPAKRAWLMFRAMMPLTGEEIAKIAGNVAPYLRETTTSSAAANSSKTPSFSPEHFRSLRWLEGDWRGSDADGKNSFYERYRFVGNDRIEMQSYKDDTMMEPGGDKSSTFLREGAIVHQAGRGVWIAERLTKDEVAFVPKENAGNNFIWKWESPDVWTATIRSKNRDGQLVERIYRLERVRR